MALEILAGPRHGAVALGRPDHGAGRRRDRTGRRRRDRRAEVRLRRVGRHGEPREPARGGGRARPGPGLAADGDGRHGSVRDRTGPGWSTSRARVRRRCVPCSGSTASSDDGAVVRTSPRSSAFVRRDRRRSCSRSASPRSAARRRRPSTGRDPAAGQKETIVVGVSGAFTENQIVAEMYAEVLEHAGYTVERQFDLRSREVSQSALESGQIDLKPEYLSSLLLFLDPNAPPSNDRNDVVATGPRAARRREGSRC